MLSVAFIENSKIFKNFIPAFLNHIVDIIKSRTRC
nr:MAG TPA: hypothetical protein [Caudoviricetes sp.]